MPCFGAFCPLLQEHEFLSCKLHFLQNSAKRSNSMPCVVVFQQSKHLVVTTPIQWFHLKPLFALGFTFGFKGVSFPLFRGLHNLTKGCASYTPFRLYYHFYYQISHKFLLLSPIKYYHKVWCGGAKKLQFCVLQYINFYTNKADANTVIRAS